MKTKITVEKDLSREDIGLRCRFSVTVEREMGLSVMADMLEKLIWKVRKEVEESVSVKIPGNVSTTPEPGGL